MNHIALAGLEGNSFENLLQEAFGGLTHGLRVEGIAEPGRSGEMAVLQRQGPFASSAVALPNFYDQMSSALRAKEFLVGIPDPDSVLVTPKGSGWADEVQRRVLDSPGSSGEFVPCVLALSAEGLSFVTERQR